MSTSSTHNLDTLDTLTNEIYDAALNHSRWPVVLERICNTFNARSAILRSQDIHTKQVGTFVLHNLDPTYQNQYQEHYVHVDPLVPAVASIPVGTLTQSIQFSERFFKSEFYNDYALPQGMGHTVGCALVKDNSHLAVFGMHRQERNGNYEPYELALLERLISHLQRALNINRHLWQLKNEADTGQEVLHKLTLGIILVDATGKPLFLNQRAEEIIAANNGLAISKNILRAHSWSDTRALHKLIFEATQSSQKSGGTIAVTVPESAQTLNILVTPVGKEQSIGFQSHNSNVQAALFIGSAGEQLEFSLEILNQLYGLTRAEARLAASLANAHSLEEYAARSGLSLHTVRSQLKSCFRKTGCHRQTELVKLVLCAPTARLYNT